MWGAFGWGIMSFISGLCVDWYSKGKEHKDYTPSFIIATTCLLLDAYVISKIEVNIYSFANLLPSYLYIAKTFNVFTVFISYNL